MTFTGLITFTGLRISFINDRVTGHLKEEALDRILWRTWIRRGYVCDARQISE